MKMGVLAKKMWDKKDKRMETKAQMNSEGELPNKMPSKMPGKMKSKMTVNKMMMNADNL